MDKKQKENIVNLLKLVIENPELEIVPMVATECVCDDTFSYWMAHWGKAQIDEYWYNEDNNRVYFKSHDFDDLVEEWMDEHFEEHPDLSDNELRELAEKKIESYDWVKVIAVRIEP